MFLSSGNIWERTKWREQIKVPGVQEGGTILWQQAWCVQGAREEDARDESIEDAEGQDLEVLQVL